MVDVLIYSTDYHLQLVKFIPAGFVAKFRIGYKGQSLLFRFASLISTIFLLSIRYRGSRIYIARFASKDNWIIYSIFRKRCTLISDGVSDFLDKLSVLEVGLFNLGFAEPVDQRFHVENIEFSTRLITHDINGPVAIYNKRGRDLDYISDYVRHCKIENFIVNPLTGGFSHIYTAPSTVIFEPPNEMREHVSIVSQTHCNALSVKRRQLLKSYEDALLKIGYRVL